MTVRSNGRLLSTVFVDYDNVYLSLKRKNEEAAKRFAKDACAWLKEIESGRLMTPTNGPAADVPAASSSTAATAIPSRAATRATIPPT